MKVSNGPVGVSTSWGEQLGCRQNSAYGDWASGDGQLACQVGHLVVCQVGHVVWYSSQHDDRARR